MTIHAEVYMHAGFHEVFVPERDRKDQNNPVKMKHPAFCLLCIIAGR